MEDGKTYWCIRPSIDDEDEGDGWADEPWQGVLRLIAWQGQTVGHLRRLIDGRESMMHVARIIGEFDLFPDEESARYAYIEARIRNLAEKTADISQYLAGLAMYVARHAKSG